MDVSGGATPRGARDATSPSPGAGRSGTGKEVARTKRGARSGKGSFASKLSVPRSLWRSFHTKCRVHGAPSGSVMAANQICQSMR